MQRIGDALRRALVPALAVATAFLLGAVVIVLTDVEHLRQLGSDPLAALGGALAGVLDGYRAMLTGAIGDPDRIATAFRTGDAEDIAAAIRPVAETLVSATPFIFAGLGLAVSFHAGLFNRADPVDLAAAGPRETPRGPRASAVPPRPRPAAPRGHGARSRG